MITPEFTLFEEISREEQVLLNSLISILAGSSPGLAPHPGAVMFSEDLILQAPGPPFHVLTLLVRSGLCSRRGCAAQVCVVHLVGEGLRLPPED